MRLTQIRKRLEKVEAKLNVGKSLFAWQNEDGTVGYDNRVWTIEEFEEHAQKHGYTEIIYLQWSGWMGEFKAEKFSNVHR